MEHRAHKLHRITSNLRRLRHTHYLSFESVVIALHEERKWPRVLYVGDQRAKYGETIIISVVMRLNAQARAQRCGELHAWALGDPGGPPDGGLAKP